MFLATTFVSVLTNTAPRADSRTQIPSDLSYVGTAIPFSAMVKKQSSISKTTFSTKQSKQQMGFGSIEGARIFLSLSSLHGKRTDRMMIVLDTAQGDEFVVCNLSKITTTGLRVQFTCSSLPDHCFGRAFETMTFDGSFGVGPNFKALTGVITYKTVAPSAYLRRVSIRFDQKARVDIPSMSIFKLKRDHDSKPDDGIFSLGQFTIDPKPFGIFNGPVLEGPLNTKSYTVADGCRFSGALYLWLVNPDIDHPVGGDIASAAVHCWLQSADPKRFRINWTYFNQDDSTYKIPIESNYGTVKR